MHGLFLPDPALRWLETILSERLGHLWTLRYSPHGLELRLRSGEGWITFDQMQECFREARSDLPFTRWDASVEGWVSVLGDPLPAPGFACVPSPLIERTMTGYLVHYDILGMAYWMLARVEEIGRTDLDQNGRFPATSSHAYKHGYLERPVVDEWFHVLRQVIQRQWPSIKLKKYHFRVDVSHDVDRPSRYLFGPVSSAMRSALGDVVLRGDVLSPVRALWLRRSSPDALHPADPYNTFGWLMDVSEQHNLQSTFYFKAGCTNPQFDAKYEIGHPAIRKLLRRIHDRGHHIGLHPSYECYRDAKLVQREAQALWRVCEEEGIRQDEWGARMHYLRWSCPETPCALDAAGLNHDSTLGYADHVGFRSGTCLVYTMFDPVGMMPLRLESRPLIAMEVSMLGRQYMNLDAFETALRLRNLKNTCLQLDGICSLLWHNSELADGARMILYNEFAKAAHGYEHHKAAC